MYVITEMENVKGCGSTSEPLTSSRKQGGVQKLLLLALAKSSWPIALNVLAEALTPLPVGCPLPVALTFLACVITYMLYVYKVQINCNVKEGNLCKPMKEQLRHLPWKLIFILSLIQLTRPILSTAGFFDNFRPQGPIIATALIALIWIGVAVIGNVREPVKVLAMAGATYAVIGVAMAVFLQAFFKWSPQETASIPLLLTAGLIGGIVVNVIWGALLGFVATGIKKALKR
jgi:hypothetical protein